jgi:hypothetical protein
MSGTIGYEELRAGTIRQVAQLMAAAAITAPKSGGQLFLAGKPGFMETVIADDPGTRRDLAAWMRARGRERRERIWFRDAAAAEAVDAILFVGLLPSWYPPYLHPRVTASVRFRGLRSWLLRFGRGWVCSLSLIAAGVLRAGRRVRGREAPAQRRRRRP